MFGAWLRKTEYTADRVGLLCCAGIDDAIGAISITTFHAIGRRVDMHVLAEQRRKLDAEPALRMGEWIGGMPYATNRLDALRRFDASSLAAGWRMRLATERVAAVPPPVALPDAVSGRDCAGVWRRTAAFVVDLAIISAIVRTPLGVTLTGHARAFPAVTSQLGSHALLVLLAYFVYGALLVGIKRPDAGHDDLRAARRDRAFRTSVARASRMALRRRIRVAAHGDRARRLLHCACTRTTTFRARASVLGRRAA